MGFDGSKLVQRKEFTWRNPGFAQTDDHPVTLVTFDDALAFTAWLTRKSARNVTLPTEAQWEYACRANTTTRFYSGDRDESARDIAWFKDNAGKGTQPVGQKKPNGFGLYDMSGNVFEWCRDWYGPYQAGPVEDPEEKRNHLTTPPRRVLRGGSWFREAPHSRSAARYRSTPGSRNADNGFRVVAAVESMDEPKKEPAQTAEIPSQPFLPSQPPGHGMPSLPIPQRIFPGPVAEPPSSWGSGSSCAILALLLLIGAGILAALRRGGSTRYPDASPARPPRAQRSGPRPVSRPVVHVERVNDGFWLNLPAVPPGAQVHYRYLLQGQHRSGKMPYEPGPRGLFIYTGDRPQDVEVLEVINPDDIGTALPAEGPELMPPPVEEPPAPQPAPGFPSAY